MGKKNKKQNKADPGSTLKVKQPDPEILSIRPPIYPHEPQAHSDYLESILIKQEVTEMQSGSFDGAIHLAFVVLVVACIRLVMINLEKKGFLVETGTIMQCSSIEGFKFLAIYLAQGISTLPIFIIQKLFALGKIPRTLLFTLYALIQTIFLCMPMTQFLPPLAPMTKVFSFVFQLVLQLKMHSYVMTNYHLDIQISEKFEDVVRKGKRKKYNIKIIEEQKKEVKKIEAKNLKSEEDLRKLDANPSPKIVSIYPTNITLMDYLNFIFAVPVLVYETKYVKSEKIRIGYLVKEFLALILCAVFIVIIITQFCLPIVLESKQYRGLFNLPAFSDILNLTISTLFVWLLGFYAFFHCYLNLASQITRFGDRRFYEDWWNSTTIDQFWRKWNIPVHEWCLRHLYVESIYHLKISATKALFFVFVVSALFHQYIFSLVFSTFTPYFFIGMFIQAPIIYLNQYLGGVSHQKVRSKRWGNLTMWISLLIGQPLLEILYFRDFFAKIPNEHSSLRFWCSA